MKGNVAILPLVMAGILILAIFGPMQVAAAYEHNWSWMAYTPEPHNWTALEPVNLQHNWSAGVHEYGQYNWSNVFPKVEDTHDWAKRADILPKVEDTHDWSGVLHKHEQHDWSALEGEHEQHDWTWMLP